MGRLFKVMAIRAPDWPDVGGARRMTVAYRNATAADAAALAELGAEHLHRIPSAISTSPTTSPSSSKTTRRELGRRNSPTRPSRSASPRSTARLVGYAKLGPPHLPFEPRGEAAELRQLYVLEDMAGAGRRRMR